MRNLAVTILFGLTTLSTSLCLGQGNETTEEDGSGWWQVEVIIFSQGNNSTMSSEVWPTDVELSYPNEWQELLPFNDPSQEEIDADGTAVVTAEPSIPIPANNLPDDNVEATDSLNEKPTYDNSKTLYLLPEEERQLSDISNKLSRNGQRRILFHQAWRQSMVQYQEEEPILITGGDQFDDHFELEGSVKIYWQRLLHFDTNLWLSEFSINTGQERQDWPELPVRPNSVIPTDSLLSLDQPHSDTLPSFTGNGGNNGTNTYSDNTFRNPRLVNPSPGIGQINTLDWLGQRGNTTFYDSRYDEILSRSYIVNNLVLLKQNRPMRSDELHYLDHPQLGILVKITAYEEPEATIDADVINSNGSNITN